MKRNIAVAFLVGGIGLSGCQSTTGGGMSLFSKNSSANNGSTAPDLGKQKFGGLAQQFTGKEPAPSAALGGSRTPPKTNFFASLSKSSAAGAAALTGKKTVIPEDDPLRLDKMPKQIGPEVYVAAARLLENQGKVAEAEDKYREALKNTPTDLNAMVGLARLYDRQGQPQKAIEFYYKATQAHPTSGLAFNDLGLCYRRQKQLDKSLLAFRKAVELVPDNAKYRNNLAGALVESGKSGEAYEQLAAASSGAVAHFNLAYMLQQRGDRGEAMQHLQQALALDSALTPAREMLAQLGGPQPMTPTASDRPAPTLAAQPAPQLPPTIPAQPAAQSLPQPVATYGYSTGAVEQGLYTLAPQVASPAQPEPTNYHVNDDRPVAETAQRPAWSSAAWAMPQTAAPATKPLPPIE